MKSTCKPQCCSRRAAPCLLAPKPKRALRCVAYLDGNGNGARPRIGVPKEIKLDEHRVAMTPFGVKVLAERGYQVLVEQGAGAGSGFPDAEYRQCGAQLVNSHDEVFRQSDLVVKVKEPIKSEYGLIEPRHTVFTFFHFAGSRELTEAMIKTGSVCIAYETVEKADGSLPILAPMSEIAGRLSLQQGMRFLEKTAGGSGILLPGVPGVAPGTVVVIGGGVAGMNAATVAAGIGARVVVLDTNLQRLRHLATILPPNVQTAFSTPSNIAHWLEQADLGVGAALVPGDRTPVLVTKAMLQRMKPGSVFVDIAIDQGGSTEASVPTTHREPIIKVGETLLYCVANMPGCVPRTSTEAITNATLPYILELAAKGWRVSASTNPEIYKGLNVVGGKVTYRRVADLFKLPYTDPRDVLAEAEAKVAAPV